MIDDADDYKSLIEDLFELTNGELKLESFTAEDNGDSAAIEVKVSGTTHTMELEVTGWINDDFIILLNGILKEKNTESRFHQFRAGDSFCGQCVSKDKLSCRN